ncbi:MAG TPA: cbb3-type cytochrome oxidase assembly protein CcoS [Arenimonas sp.]|uniref:cbb3-type cytochrome oxidase assembly protein CcoS n=1 Tax=Arenimonas sp. TaxID=1872635 RepID=UPI002CE80CAF|nr:cbb3-type cytochrome oxidase assembly protein CcoS [Arenimonas sp.]HMB56586.1 cbb3-type cytochrome oxidase assembly protein CcoS [Arenimonas sp.]
MNILLVLIPISLALLGLAIAAFFWAVRSDQFEDMDSAAMDILREDPPPMRDDDNARIGE